MNKNILPLGVIAEDIVTGFSGIISGRVSYLTGCDQYLLQPKCKDGKFEEARWFDANRVKRSGNEPAVVLDTAANDGPCDAAPIK